MLKVIRKLLTRVIEDIDAGNSSISEEEGEAIVKYITAFTDRRVRLSKYEAARYIGVGRSLFDKYVREGLIPRGIKEAGFKELSWMKKDLDEAIIKIRKRKEARHGQGEDR